MFVPRRLSEKFRAKNKKLFFISVDLEKAFDRVLREVISFALRWKGVPEYLVNEVLCLFIKVVKLYKGSQRTALSPLLFIEVMDVLTEDVRDGSLMELLDADDLVLCE